MMTKRLSRHISIIVVLAVMLINTSCENHNGAGSKPFTLTCEDFTGERDSATLYLYEEAYGSWREAGRCDFHAKQAQISGSVFKSQIARLDFNNHKKSFYFIVEPGSTIIEFHQRYKSIQGGTENHKYFTFKNQCDSINRTLTINEKRRIQLAADTASWAHKEIGRLLKADSVLRDSLSVITKRISDGNEIVNNLCKIYFDK